MPYCPKCDMEFIDGTLQCSDCGGMLMESKEAYDALKRIAMEEERARLQAAYETQAQYLAQEAESAEANIDKANGHFRRPAPYTGTYVRKSEKYDDLKSSASAFFIVGSSLTVFALLCWLGILKLPLGIISRLMLTALGIGALAVAFRSAKDAKSIRGQIQDEEDKTKQLIAWFTDNFNGSRLDQQLLSEYGELLPEELSLKRFELIQDLLITNHDLEDPAYADLLAEEIYGKLYPEEDTK